MAEYESSAGTFYLGTIEVETAAGSGLFFELAEVTNVDPPDEQADELEATHTKSPNRRKEFKPGLTDPGEMGITINYVPGGQTDTFIVAWKASAEVRKIRITQPNGVRDNYSGFCKGYKWSGGANALETADIRCRMSGGYFRDAA